MTTYILAFFIILFAMVIMAIGVMSGGQRIRGSCGGISCFGCKNKNNKKACPRRQEIKQETES